jgi:hypothetical protein
MTTPTRAPLVVVALIVAIIMAAILFVVAMNISGWMLIGLVLCIGVVGALLLGGFRGFTLTRLAWQKERNRHIEEVIQRGFDPNTYLPVVRPAQISAPQTHKQIEWKPELEKWRWTAVDYVVLTIDTLGRDSKKLISANEAQKLDDWKGAGRIQNAFDFLSGNLLAYVKMSGGKQEGTYIQDEMTAGELMAILSPARLRGVK